MIEPTEAEIKAWLQDPRYAWVPFGRNASGLVEVDRLVGVVYRADADAGVDESGEPVVAEAGYFFVDSDLPRNAVWIAGADITWEEAWMRAAIEFKARRARDADSPTTD